MPTQTISNKLLPLLKVQKSIKIVFGGRGGGKSQTIADCFIQKAVFERCKIGCFREYQNTLADSVHSLISDQIESLGATGFKITDNYIDHSDGGEFRFRGLSRNTASVKSFHKFKYFWIEEGQFLSEDSLQLLIPTLREEGSELWISLNPLNSTDAVFMRYIKPHWNDLLKNKYYEDDQILVIWVNYDDNPWFPEKLENDRRADFNNLDRSMYDHIWLGHPSPVVENAIIKREWFDACIDAHLKLGFEPRGIRYSTFDPADQGEDAKAWAFRHGSVFLAADATYDGDINEGCDWALDKSIAHDSDAFTWDCDGLGAGLKRQVAKSFEGKPTLITMFKGSEAVDNPDSIFEPTENMGSIYNQKMIKEVIKNKRAQYYLELMQRIFNTYKAVEFGKYCDPDKMISFSSDIECLPQMREEICKIPKKPSSAGMFELYSKPEMKTKFKLASPNLADVVMMSMRTPQQNIINAQMVIPKPIKVMGRR